MGESKARASEEGFSSMSDVAIVARLRSAFWRGKRKFQELEPIVQEQLCGGMTCCTKHERPLWFQGESCPCCQIIAEFGRSVEAG
jgi:hypothetical protein